MRRVFPLLLILILSGCPQRIDPTNPVTPDDGNKPDSALVIEFQEAFGELGKEDARKFGGYFHALSDFIEEQPARFNSPLTVDVKAKPAREMLKIAASKYPAFKSRVQTLLEPYGDNVNFTDDTRKGFCDVLDKVGTACEEAGR